MERNRLYAPNARPFNSAFFFSGKSSARLLRFAIHASQDLGIEIALIERGFAASHHGSHNSRKSLDATDGADRVSMVSGDRPDFKRQLRSGGQGVVTCVHGCRSRMRLLPKKRDRMPLHALRA